MLQGITARAETAVPLRSGQNEGATVSMPVSVPYPLQLDFHADHHITRWRPLVQWLLAIPHLMIAYVLRSLRQVLTLISFFTVLITEQIPRPLFDAIAMTYRYEWRAMSYFTGQYPEGIRDFLVSSYRYALRVEAYVGFLTDRYLPFSLAA